MKATSDNEIMKFSTEFGIIIIFENGQLGNQLFQYVASRKAAPNSRVLRLGLHPLVHFLEHVDEILESRWLHFLRSIFRRLGHAGTLKLSGKGKLFSLITENLNGDSHSFQIQRGLFSKIALINGFFQNENLLLGVSSNYVRINQDLLIQSQMWKNSLTSVNMIHHYFVHIRRGDYLYWPTADAPAVLSGSWYLAQMARIRESDGNAQFFIFSNDLAYVDELFLGLKNIFISRSSDVMDLASMTLCYGGGILSASTFSWWASFYIKNQNPKAVFIGPKFWAGWQEKKWFPPFIQTSWIEYCDGF